MNETINPNALTIDQLVAVFNKVGPATEPPITREMIEQDITAGFQTRPDGTIHLIEYIAWLLRERKRDQ